MLLIFLSSWAQLQSWQQSCLAGKAPPHWLHGIREPLVFFQLDAGWFSTSFAKFFHQGLGYRHTGELGWAGVLGQRNQRNSRAPSRDKGHTWCPPAPQGERVVDIAPSAWLPVLGARWSSVVSLHARHGRGGKASAVPACLAMGQECHSLWKVLKADVDNGL